MKVGVSHKCSEPVISKPPVFCIFLKYKCTSINAADDLNN